jgi:histidinol phosphatase-like enzyme
VLSFEQLQLMEFLLSAYVPFAFIFCTEPRGDLFTEWLEARAGDLLQNPIREGLIVGNNSDLSAAYQAAIKQSEKSMGEEAMFCVSLLGPWIREKGVDAMQ